MANLAKKKNNDNNSAIAKAKLIRTSPRKLNLVAKSIRNMSASNALMQLKFMQKKVAPEVRKCVKQAIANAEHNYGLDIDNLYIEEAVVGKSILMKRIRPRARGSASRINKFFSNLRIKVTEIEE
jgi:large subunit ribosomal protein L22